MIKKFSSPCIRLPIFNGKKLEDRIQGMITDIKANQIAVPCYSFGTFRRHGRNIYPNTRRKINHQIKRGNNDEVNGTSREDFSLPEIATNSRIRKYKKSIHISHIASVKNISTSTPRYPVLKYNCENLIHFSNMSLRNAIANSKKKVMGDNDVNKTPINIKEKSRKIVIPMPLAIN